jgi:hypothetical protein
MVLATGRSVTTGFEPAFVMLKSATQVAVDMYDNIRNTNNSRERLLTADTSDAEWD